MSNNRLYIQQKLDSASIWSIGRVNYRIDRANCCIDKLDFESQDHKQ